MIEKVNPSHPDKVADRIAGALVDLAYMKADRPKIAVEVLIGHGTCHIIAETSVSFEPAEVRSIVDRIVCHAPIFVDYKEVPQDAHLAANQDERARCGDNGIFKGVPLSEEEKALSAVIRKLYKQWPTDGKFIYSAEDRTFVACQSNLDENELGKFDGIIDGALDVDRVITNPLGFWTGGTDVDTGATNRKLGSDMGRAVTGGGLHGKDLSKADVAVNIVCHVLAQLNESEISAFCAIGDEHVTFKSSNNDEVLMLPYGDILEKARCFIRDLGGFEKLAEWGLF